MSTTLLLFLTAQISPFLFAITNHIDKHLLEKYFKDGAVEALLIFSALASIVALPFIWIVAPMFTGHPFQFFPESIDLIPAYLLLGLLASLLIWSYLKALFQDEPAAVVIFYQLLPIAGYFFGWIFLGETVSLQLGWALIVILMGTTIMAFQMDTLDGKFKIRWRTAGYMCIASISWALGSVVLKVTSISDDVWRTMAWEHFVIFLVGIFLVVFFPKFRNSFTSAYKANSLPVLGLNGLNEALYMIGVIVMSYLSIQTLIVIVQMAQTFQALYAWLIGLVLVAFKIRSSDFSGSRANIQMIAAIFVTGFGSYLLWLAESV